MAAKAIASIAVPPEVFPFMAKHGARAAKMLNDFTASCTTIDEKLGALGVMAQILLAYGDTLQAMQLAKTPDNKPSN